MINYIDFGKKIMKYAKKIMLKYYKTNNGGYFKTDKTIVTKADMLINNYLIEQVKKYYPTYSVDGEEEHFGKSNYVWVCDPVDGTAMYACHIPVAVTSLALVVDGQPIFGMVYDVFGNKLYYAEKGKGAYLNGSPIAVNNLDFEEMKTIGHIDVWPYSLYEVGSCVKELGKVSYPIALGTVTHSCMKVASGDFSYVIFGGGEGKNVDVAAAKVIVEEAGGIVTDFQGNEQRYDQPINGCVISNKVLHKQLLEYISKYAIKR